MLVVVTRMDMYQCRFCGYEWRSRVEVPKKCPSCWHRAPVEPPKVEA